MASLRPRAGPDTASDGIRPDTASPVLAPTDCVTAPSTPPTWDAAPRIADGPRLIAAAFAASAGPVSARLPRTLPRTATPAYASPDAAPASSPANAPSDPIWDDCPPVVRGPVDTSPEL